jgi:hypothetical protein
MPFFSSLINPAAFLSGFRFLGFHEQNILAGRALWQASLGWRAGRKSVAAPGQRM